MPGRVRFAVATLLVLLGAFLGVSLELRGVTGDVMPIVDWRWAPEPGESVAGPSAGEAGEAPTSSAVATSSPQDYPQYLGPERDGRLKGIPLSRDWSVAPKQLWRQPVGAGWSGFAVAGGFAVTHKVGGITFGHNLGRPDGKLHLIAGNGRQKIAADNIDKFLKRILLLFRRDFSAVLQTEHIGGHLRQGRS